MDETEELFFSVVVAKIVFVNFSNVFSVVINLLVATDCWCVSRFDTGRFVCRIF